jgi:hypothetical protein
MCIANDPGNARYPETVVYRSDANGNVWARPLSDWHRSMTLCEAYRRKEAGDAYLRGVQAGLKDAAQTAHSIWQTHNDPKVIADALGSMSRDPGYVSAVSSRVGTTR